MPSARTAALAAAVAVVCGSLMVPTTAAAAPQDVPSPPSNGAAFTPVAPTRVLDTRVGTGGRLGAVAAGGTTRLKLSAVPAEATAVVLNVTGVGATANTFVTVFPAGAPRPTASSLNLAPGDTRPNQVTATLGVDRSLDLFNNAGNTHLVADLAGFYAPGAGSKFTALPGKRVLDTRERQARGARRTRRRSVPAADPAVGHVRHVQPDRDGRHGGHVCDGLVGLGCAAHRLEYEPRSG
ncbi:hypothetical protein [Actinokineospora xionganensis]|uniref:DUF4397 domain-containing protein n=1 Tax=Actinokineospora xionganensis TaxID=2684470 RepID=A0ABR7L338_9PSEU|nr:hypothetical protein [Actinokineospora xionganensis]MBC6446839.1 hypothetical protein [Actinokineospora xionganensis]